MPKKMEGTMHLCLGTNGLDTPMEKVRVRLEKPKKGSPYLKELGGKRKFAYDPKLCFKEEYKGRTQLDGFIDRETDLPLHPQEVMTGLEFSRADIKNAISYQLDAEREARARYKSQQTDTATKLMAIALIITSIFMVIGGYFLAHPQVVVYTQPGPPPSGPLSNIGNTITNSAQAVTGAIP